ncbi:MAG: cytidylate kinase family protein [Enterocloster sp.]
MAEELGIHFYDEEILKMTSETSAIGEQYFRLADEKGRQQPAVPHCDRHEAGADGAGEGRAPTSPPSENLFRFQSSVIRRSGSLRAMHHCWAAAETMWPHGPDG